MDARGRKERKRRRRRKDVKDEVEGEEARVGSRVGREEDWKRRGWSGAESKIHRLRLS